MRDCPDCNAAPATLHDPGCDVERCPECGGQAISCGCEPSALPRLSWTGEWPGKAECRAFGWYAKLVPGKGWVSCDASEPGATEDLNRLMVDCAWNPARAKWEKHH